MWCNVIDRNRRAVRQCAVLVGLLGLVGPAHGSGDSRVLLDVLAASEGGPERSEERVVLAVVQVTKNRHDGLGGLLSAVEGNTGEEVVDNVEANDTVEEVLVDPAKVAVDGGKGALDVGPVVGVVVVDVGVSMVEVGNGNCWQLC